MKENIENKEIEKVDEILMSESEMTEQLDLVDNAVYAALCALLGYSTDGDEAPEFPWNIEIINKGVEALSEVLKEKKLTPCYPFWMHSETEDTDENGIRCYRSEDRCQGCKVKA